MATTWNEADKTAHVTLSNGGHTATSVAGSGNEGVRATTSKSSGKWYLEFSGIDTGGFSFGVGFSSAANALDDNPPVSLLHYGGFKEPAGGGYGGIGPNPITGHHVSFAFDIDAKRLWVRTDGGVWWGRFGSGGDPAAGTNYFDTTNLNGEIFPAVRMQFNPTTCDINAGDLPFVYNPPEGFLPWEGGGAGGAGGGGSALTRARTRGRVR